MIGIRTMGRVGVLVGALAAAQPGTVLADTLPDAQTKKTMQDWTAADTTCRTTLAQEACQRRDETWNWLFGRGWRRDASGKWFNYKSPMNPAPSYVRP